MSDSGAADIAIVGMACRFPGAANPGEFWSLLSEGREARTELGDAELLAAGVAPELLRDPDYVKAGMFLPNMEQFDPGFFGFSPLDGRILDPQHRHFLECTWEALEDAGYDPYRYPGAIGVFAGSGHNAYLPYNLLSNPQLVADVGFFLLRHTGNDKDFLATRASYCFDLRGPSVNVQTACSTSLVAVHNAAQSLLGAECDMALAGGVTIELPHRHGYLFKDSEILSRDGHCRPFDASAGGTVFGSGVGVVVLKRLRDALADRDTIHAVIRASAVNNDGAAKVSYLAPSVDGQAEVIAEALAIAGIEPATVSYIATHGTGTQLGDPIEVAALAQSYGDGHTGRQYCALGSVKSNIGHTDTAAGVASLISVALAMRHRAIPPTLHYRAPNPAIDFARTPFFVCDRLQPWNVAFPRRAGVSSLGVGGTNAHLVVEEAPAPRVAPAPRARHLLLLSARSETALLRNANRLARHLDDAAPEPGELADAAYTLAVGRHAFRRRAFAVVDSHADALQVLEGGGRDRLVQAEAPGAPRRIAFMFAGGGAQYPAMGRGLYESEAVYRAAVDECLDQLRSVVDFDLKPLLFPRDESARRAAESELERPSRTLPALFVAQYAQARLWQSWGVEPAAMIGHSMGENTAACLAGVFSLRDALGLVSLRGRLFESVGEGSMLSVDLDESALLPLLGTELSLAAINAPGLAVASGPRAALRELEQRLAERDIGCRRIRIDVAAHSAMLDPILGAFADYLRSIRLGAPAIPFLSNRSGDWITAAEATSPDYWVAHLRHTVRFSDCAARLLDAGDYVMLEVGPGRTLASLVGSHPGKQPGQAILTSMRHPGEEIDDDRHMLGALGRIWLGGAEVDWERFHAGQERRRIPLPTYAFDHMRCWVEPGQRPSGSAAGSDAGERGSSPAEWLYQCTWQRSPLPANDARGPRRVLMLGGGDVLADAVARALQLGGGEVRRVQVADARRIDATVLQIRCEVADDCVHLVDALGKSGWAPECILNLLPLELGAAAALPGDAARSQALAFDALLNLAQACAGEDWAALRWLTLTRSAFQLAGEPIHSPFAALALGPMRVLPREFPGWETRVLDIAGGEAADTIAAHIASELAASDGWCEAERVVAVRGNARYVQTLAQRPAPARAAQRPQLHADGVYLVTGGTGGLGLVAAEALASVAPVTLVLVSRHGLPAEEHWPALVAGNAPEAAILARLQHIGTLGARVVLEVADVADREAVRALAGRIAPLGRVRGIVHTAGVLDDAPVLAKDAVQCARVLAAKVAGTTHLDEIFAGDTLDFLALYSSTSALQGLPGQIDYTAANAFLDAWAHLRCGEGANVLSINWPAWKDVGMAASAAAGRAAQRLPAGRPLAGPLLQREVERTPARSVFATLFSVEDFWLLAEHRIKDGPALIPGSGYLEIARAAFAAHGGSDGEAIEIRNAAFDMPFVVGDSERRVLRVEIAGDAFVLSSESFGEHVEHARGLIGAAEPLAERIDVAAVRARCTRREQRFTDPDHHPFLQFGARWECLQTVRVGEREALVELALDARFHADLAGFALHPALYDMATAGAQIIIDDYLPREELYVPIGCSRLLFNGRFASPALAHVRYRPPEAGRHAHDIARFDVLVADAEGRVFLAVEDFTMRRVGDPRALKTLAPPEQTAVHPVLRRTIELGIEPAEGRSVLLRLLAGHGDPQCIVSPWRPGYVSAELLRLALPQPVVEPPRHDPDLDPDIAAVEAALGACPAIAAVAVRSFAADAGERRLVAFVAPDPARFTTMGEVRRFARAQLPPDTQPEHFVEIDEWPLDAAGELDRSALQDPLAPVDSYVAPRTATEKSLARIWQDVLGVTRAGLTDNFFDLGGHSLLSTRVIVQVFRKTGVRLDQPTMVLNTLEQVARELEQRMQAAGSPAGSAAAHEPPAETPRPRGRGLLGSLFGRS